VKENVADIVDTCQYTRQTELLIRLRAWVGYPQRIARVEPDAWRRACPVRRRLAGVILQGAHHGFPCRVIPSFYPIVLLAFFCFKVLTRATEKYLVWP
jgi:hypothetical protein